MAQHKQKHHGSVGETMDDFFPLWDSQIHPIQSKESKDVYVSTVVSLS